MRRLELHTENLSKNQARNQRNRRGGEAPKKIFPTWKNVLNIF